MMLLGADHRVLAASDRRGLDRSSLSPAFAWLAEVCRFPDPIGKQAHLGNHPVEHLLVIWNAHPA